MLAKSLHSTFVKAILLIFFFAQTTSLLARTPPSEKQQPDALSKRYADKSLMDWITRGPQQEKRTESKKQSTHPSCSKKVTQPAPSPKQGTELASSSNLSESKQDTEKAELIPTPSLYIMEMASKRYQDSIPDSN